MPRSSFLPYALPSLLGCALSLSFSLYVWRRRAGPVRAYGALLGLAVAWWCGGQLIWFLTSDALARKRVSQFQYVGITSSPVLWLLLALAYQGRRAWLSGWRRLALFAVPATSVVLVLTNDLHGLVWRRFEAVPGQTKALVSYGPWFYVLTLYSYGLVFLASALLTLRFAASPLYRVQALVVLLGTLAIMAANLLHIMARSGLPIDPTPAGFAVGVGALAWALWRHRMFDLLPLARGIAVERLRDGILVLDDAGRVVDANPAANALLGLDTRVLGAPLANVLPLQVDLQAVAPRELRLPNGRRVEVHVSAVSADDGGSEGHVVLLRDVTDARQAQDRLLEAQQQLSALNRELEKLAHTDALTGLANRRLLLARLEEEWARARRRDRPIALLLIDFDHFKRVNDTHGHLVGDRVLEAAGQTLAALVRPEDLPARYGGEELALLLPETDLDGACDAARRVRDALRGLPHVDDLGQPFRVTVSVGIAVLQARAGASRDLMARADAALYHAKANGRDGLSRAVEAGCERVALG